ncbi:heavy-metal-associated domain-containing protein [uncultured Microbacterium sp.]|uniref:heavy-metal-associated domain-containing protein n=1 Tax=uncultured Microbacterium sp. TaxID=191216 RepID=UPI0035CBEEA8
MTIDNTLNVLVDGMTCAHCVTSVTEEIAAIDGVEAVHVDLNPGGASSVAVRTTSPIDPASIRAAVEEAGYTVAAPR